jgi:hypothetical protein
MLAAGIGGLMTRNHATTALNAAADVMKAYHQGDLERFDQEYKRWQASNQNMLKMQNYELNAYKAILGAYGKDADRAIREGGLDERAVAAEAHAVAVSLHDDEMAKRAAAGDVRGMLRLMIDRERLTEQMEINSGKVEEAKALKDATTELRESPEYAAADPLTRYGMLFRVVHQKAPSLDTRGDGSQNDLRIAETVYRLQFMPDGVKKQDTPEWDAWYKDTWPTWAGGPKAAIGRQPSQRGTAPLQNPEPSQDASGASVPDQRNFQAADAALAMTPQEQALYKRHLANLYGPGGVHNADGSISTLYQTSVEIGGKVYNIPTVYDGKILSPQEALARAKAQGIDNFPSYPDEKTAESRYNLMHDFMEKDTASYISSSRRQSTPFVVKDSQGRYWQYKGSGSIDDKSNFTPVDQPTDSFAPAL